MAPPKQPTQRRNQSSQNEHVYALGVRGRKTGVTLEDTGERDEYGMEPVDRLFSSPEKDSTDKANGFNRALSEEEQDMDIDEASTLGPATVARMRKDRLSLPRARSPAKTFLNSPARQNPHFGRNSSPTRGTIVEDHTNTAKSAKRRLDLNMGSQMKPTVNGHLNANRSGSQNGKTNRHVEQESDSDDDAVLPGRQASINELSDDDEEEPMDILDMGGDDIESLAATEEEVQDDAEDPVEEIRPRKRGRKPKTKDAEDSIVEEDAAPALESEEADEEPIKKKRGRPGKNALVEKSESGAKSPKRRRPGRPSLTNDNISGSNESDAAEEPETKRQKTETKSKASNAAASKSPVAKGKPGRKRKSSGVGAESPAVVPRPPMPKQRGLQSLRREELAVKTTRSGRISTKPLEFWRGEHYEIDPNDEELLEDKAGRRIKVGSTIKGVVRVNYEEAPKTKRGRAKASGTDRRKRRVSDMEEEDDYREDWEDNPGRMMGECIYWYADYEENPPQEEDQVEVDEMELGISEAAIQMRDIKDATFKFSKTLTLPFFGTGLVDLPPQSEKRSKNARKMQMGFFVHYGNVKVTVSQTTFRISKGGQFFVPRGNTYQIENDTERPARLFFSQGCEVRAAVPESQEL